MCYTLGVATVYYNAFYAALKHDTRVLSDDDITLFCDLIRDFMPKAVELYNEPRSGTVIFDFDDADFFAREQRHLSRVGEWIIYSGPEITLDRIKRINLRLGFGAALCAVVSARKAFERYLSEREGGPSAERRKLLEAV